MTFFWAGFFYYVIVQLLFVMEVIYKLFVSTTCIEVVSLVAAHHYAVDDRFFSIWE